MTSEVLKCYVSASVAEAELILRSAHTYRPQSAEEDRLWAAVSRSGLQKCDNCTYESMCVYRDGCAL